MNYDFLKKKKLKNFLSLVSTQSEYNLDERYDYLYNFIVIGFCKNYKKTTFFCNSYTKKKDIQKSFNKVSIFDSRFFKISKASSNFYFYKTGFISPYNSFSKTKSSSIRKYNEVKLFAFDQNLPQLMKSDIVSNQLPSLHSLNTLSIWSNKNRISKTRNKIQENFLKKNPTKKTNETFLKFLTEEENLVTFPNIKQKTKFYTSYSKLSEIKLLTIGLASPLRILQWAEKTLPNGKIYGEVLNANTLHHKTFKPQKGGLFCERIFGPLKDFECACGKINKANKKLQTVSLVVNNMEDSQILNENKIEQKFKNTLNRKYCPDCDVEYTWSVIRRYQLGYIKLCSPVTHIWFLKGTPSYLSLLLDIKKRYLQFVTYCSEILTIEKSSIPIYSVNLYSNSQSQLDININYSETSIGLESVIKKDAYNTNKHWRKDATLQNSLTNQTSLDLKEDFFEKNSLNLYKIINLLNEKNDKTVKILKPKKISYFLLKRKSNKKSFYFFPNSNEQKLPIYFYKNLNNNPNLFLFIGEEETKEKKNKIVKRQLDQTFLSLLNNLNIIKLSSSSFSLPTWRNIPVVLQKTNKQIKEGTTIISLLLLNLYIKNFNLNFNFKNLSKNKKIILSLKKNVQNKKSKSVSFFIIDKANNKKSLFFSKKTFGINFDHIYTESFFTEKQIKTKQELLFLLLSLCDSCLFASFVPQPSHKDSFSSQSQFASRGFAKIKEKEKEKEKEKDSQSEKGNKLQKIHDISNVSFLKKTNSFLKKLPNIKNILKKLPLDLYILCLLKPMLHKSSLTLAIKKTWQYLYKQAFIKSIYKAKNIFYKFLISLKSKTQINLFDNNFINEMHYSSLVSKTNFLLLKQNLDNTIKNKKIRTQIHELKTPFFSIIIEKQRLIFLKFILFIQNQQIDNFITKNQTNNKKLQDLKNLYMNHLCKLFENIPNEIMSLKYITNFLQKNDFLSIKKKISLDIEKYLLKKTIFIQKFLIKYFLNSFILDFYYLFIFNLFKHQQIIKTYIINVASNVHNKFLPVLQNKTNFKNRIIKKVNSKSRQAYVMNFISNINPVLYTYKNYLNFSSLCKNQTFLILTQRKEVFDNVTKPIHIEVDFVGLAKIGHINWFFKKYKEKNTNNFMSINSNLNNFFQFEKNYSSQINQVEFKTTKSLYNNIYTLSHRERWAIEKDWQIFTWFAFGPTNYLDFIISNYKNRLFSLKNDEISSFTLSNNNNFDDHNNFVNNFSKANSQKDSLVNFSNSLKNNQRILTSSFTNYSFFSGAGIIQQLLNEFNFYEIKKLDKQNRLILYQLNKSILKLKKQVQIFVYDKNSQVELRELCKKRDLLIRRTKLVRKLFRKNSNPTSMILNLIPVLPPDLRPIVKMGNQIAASDLNRLYQRVIYRNDRLKKFLKDAATSQSYEMKYAQRLLQEAVDNLLQNGKSGSNSEKDSRGRALKSLSDVLKGKQGRFRQFLLGKRVDYSGRSVIVVGPKLKLHECGLPLEMAKELYLPFLLKSLLNKNYAKTVIGAKTLIKNNSSLAHELLREIMQVSPVLLNRAPTLHRLGFQAFVPKLIEGRAILLHPLVCSAFNADFDGDQMAVHVPITIEARAEAWKLMLSKNNLLSTATGDPLAIPSQDMVLGCYYLTTFSNHGKILKGSGLFFNSLQDVIKLYEQNIINIHSLIWVKWTNLVENTNEQENYQSCEIRISSFGQWQEINSNSYKIYDTYNNLINQYILTTPGRILFNLLIQKILIN